MQSPKLPTQNLPSLIKYSFGNLSKMMLNIVFKLNHYFLEFFLENLDEITFI